MTEWRSIETGPHDGTYVRLFIPYQYAISKPWTCEDVGRWEADEGEGGGCWRFSGDDGPDDIQPIAWAPLSPIPVEWLPEWAKN
jgi:hypothetical protein